jgi:hypothetical protein
VTTTHQPRHPGRPGQTCLRPGFPASPGPGWTPAELARWHSAREIADASPGTPGQGGWTDESLPVPLGGVAALGLACTGGLASIVAAVHAGSVYPGLAGITAAGLAGMLLAWRWPPADLATGAVTGAGQDAMPAAAQNGTGR